MGLYYFFQIPINIIFSLLPLKNPCIEYTQMNRSRDWTWNLYEESKIFSAIRFSWPAQSLPSVLQHQWCMMVHIFYTALAEATNQSMCSCLFAIDMDRPSTYRSWQLFPIVFWKYPTQYRTASLPIQIKFILQ